MAMLKGFSAESYYIGDPNLGPPVGSTPESLDKPKGAGLLLMICSAR